MIQVRAEEKLRQTTYLTLRKNELPLHCPILVKMTRKLLILLGQRVDKILTRHLSNFSQKFVKK